jgi:hypothetical protein
MSQLSFISIITVSYKQSEVLNQLLASLRGITWEYAMHRETISFF